MQAGIDWRFTSANRNSLCHLSKKSFFKKNIKKISKTSTQRKNLLLKCKNKTD